MASTTWSPDHSPTMSELRARLAELRSFPDQSLLTSGGGSLADGPSLGISGGESLADGPSFSLSSRPLAQGSWLTEMLGEGISSAPPSLRVLYGAEKKLMEINKERASYFDLEEVKPKVIVDNNSCAESTLVTLEDSFRGDSLVHILKTFRSLALEVEKARFMSDGPHYYHVFHVKDAYGCKIGNAWSLQQIEKRFGQYWTQQETTPSSVPELLVEVEITAPYQWEIVPRATSLLQDMGCHISSVHSRKFGTYLVAIWRIHRSSRVSFVEDIENNLNDNLGTLIDWMLVSRCTAVPIPTMERRLFWVAMDNLHYRAAKIVNMPLTGKSVSVTKCNDSGYTLVTVEGRLEGSGTTRVHSAIINTLEDLGYVIVHGSVTREVQEFYVRGGGGPNLDEMAILKKYLEFSLHWCSLEGTNRRKFCRLESPPFMERTVAKDVAIESTTLATMDVAIESDWSSLTGLTWYGDESTTLATMDVAIESDSEIPTTPEPETSTVKKIFGFGTVFLKGLANVARLYAKTLE